MKVIASAALAAALCLASTTFAPALAEKASGETQSLRAKESKPTVKSRYGATVKSRRVLSSKTKKPVAVTSRFSGKSATKKSVAKSRAGKIATKSRASRSASKSRTTRLASKSRTSRSSSAALRSSNWTGTASYYRHGKLTANGERFKPMGLTAAHRSLPFGTKVRVTHARTGRSVVVRINDRGPFVGGRIIDLAMGAARAIGVTGVAKVSLQVLN